MRWHAAALLGRSPAVWGMNPDGGDHWGLLHLAVGVVLAAWVGSRSRRCIFWGAFHKCASHARGQSLWFYTKSSAHPSHIFGISATLGSVPMDVRLSSPP